jgi:catechol 2,3-dioxygenase-like lactoylglutathione lyase family enzyme
MHLALFSILVRDYDEAIAFYTNVLGFELLEDTTLEPATAERPFAKRWVRVRPRPLSGAGSGGGTNGVAAGGAAAGGGASPHAPVAFLLAQASTPAQQARVGDQTGGRVGIFLHTDDFWRDYNVLASRGVRFVRPPSRHEYGTVAVFEDLYGNLFDLVGPGAARGG